MRIQKGKWARDIDGQKRIDGRMDGRTDELREGSADTDAYPV